MAVTKKTETKASVKEVVKAEPAVKEAAVEKAPEGNPKAAGEKEAAPKKETVSKKAEAPKKEAAAKKEEPVKKEAPEKKETLAKKEEPARKAAAAKKAPEKKAVKSSVYVQYAGKEISADRLVEEVKKLYLAEGHKEAEIKSIEVYVKPEEDVAYYTVNGEGAEGCKICL